MIDLGPYKNVGDSITAINMQRVFEPLVSEIEQLRQLCLQQHEALLMSQADSRCELESATCNAVDAAIEKYNSMVSK